MASFAEAIAVDGKDGTYTAQLDPEWTVNGNPHGGYLLAVMAHAAVIADDERAHPHPLSASAVYVTPPAVGPATIEVEHLRRGRAASQVRARLVQGDDTRVEALFTLGRLTDHAEPSWVDQRPPAMTPLEECPVSEVTPPGAGVRVAMLD
ncbi:MAG TPA: thioesterase family protein, partial [Micromonosporaceae bacterium]|nr:thioesterase family protein [Micromonosporaceae bacterium]